MWLSPLRHTTPADPPPFFAVLAVNPQLTTKPIDQSQAGDAKLSLPPISSICLHRRPSASSADQTLASTLFFDIEAQVGQILV